MTRTMKEHKLYTVEISKKNRKAEEEKNQIPLMTAITNIRPNTVFQH